MRSASRKIAAVRLPRFCLLLAEGHTVGTLVHGGIVFVGTDQDPVQRTVVFTLAMVGALLDGAFNALVCVTVHIKILL